MGTVLSEVQHDDDSSWIQCCVARKSVEPAFPEQCSIHAQTLRGSREQYDDQFRFNQKEHNWQREDHSNSPRHSVRSGRGNSFHTVDVVNMDRFPDCRGNSNNHTISGATGGTDDSSSWHPHMSEVNQRNDGRLHATRRLLDETDVKEYNLFSAAQPSCERNHINKSVPSASRHIQRRPYVIIQTKRSGR